jgi:hypothetical protein
MTKKEKKNQQHGGAAVDFPFTLLIQIPHLKKKKELTTVSRERRNHSHNQNAF